MPELKTLMKPVSRLASSHAGTRTVSGSPIGARARLLPSISRATANSSCGRPRFRAVWTGYPMGVYSSSPRETAFYSAGSSTADW